MNPHTAAYAARISASFRADKVRPRVPPAEASALVARYGVDPPASWAADPVPLTEVAEVIAKASDV